MVYATGGAFEIPFETIPTKGEHDFETCDGCQNNLKFISESLRRHFEGKEEKAAFPYCCENHRKLLKLKEFNMAFYAKVPEMTARKIIYTNQHIINTIGADNWYKDITDYVEYTVESFGQLPDGYGSRVLLPSYLMYVKDMLKKNEDVDKERKSRLLEYFEAYDKPQNEQNTDLNILIGTYEKWFKIFPFGLNTYFRNLKKKYETQFPILSGKPEYNPYSRKTTFKLHTKSSLIEALTNLTNSIITQINGVTLYERGLLTDANKTKLELVVESRKLKLNRGYLNKSKSEEKRYRNILKEWLADEKRFIDEITPLLKELPPPSTQTTEINTFCPSMPLSIPESHFRVLTEKASSNGKPYLTEQQLQAFLDRAFRGEKGTPKQKINKGNREKLLVQSLFWEFYDKYCFDYFHTMHCQDDFIRLLTDNFEGWDFQNVKHNFTPKSGRRL